MDRKITLAWSVILSLFCLLIFTACGPGSLFKSENDLLKNSDLAINEPTQTPKKGDITSSDVTEKPDQSDLGQSGEDQIITIKVIFDNYSVRDDLNTAWGFSAYLTYQNQNVLFDTGADGIMLLKNMAAMDIDPAQIQNVVLSHQHNDHTNGLQAIISSGAEAEIYLLPSFSSAFKRQFEYQTGVVEVSPGQKIIDLVYSTGEIQGSVPEQALVLDTAKGLVVITGCAHPGVDNMVRKAKEFLQKDVYLVMGGFHLDGASNYQVNQIVQELQRLGVENVAPCHCTGLRSINIFKDEFGDNYIKIGVGAVIELES